MQSIFLKSILLPPTQLNIEININQQTSRTGLQKSYKNESDVSDCYLQIGLNTANFASYLEPSEKSSHDDMNKAPTTTLSDFVDELLSCML